MMWENERRNRKQGRTIEPESPEMEDAVQAYSGHNESGDVTDWQNENYRYCL